MEDIKSALKTYFAEWNVWAAQTTDFSFNSLKPMHVGWKVADEAAVATEVGKRLPFARQGHIGTVDNRKIILLVPNEAVEGVPIVQIMQLRPGSSDPLGLDHVAFYCPKTGSLEAALQASKIKWERQSNPGHAWISLWFGDKQREAKFFDHTSLDLGSQELHVASEAIKSR